MSTPSTKRWFQITSYGSLKEVEIESVSAKFVTFPNGRREARENGWAFFSQRKDDCKQWLVAHCEEEVQQAKRNLEYVEEKLSKAKAIEV